MEKVPILPCNCDRYGSVSFTQENLKKVYNYWFYYWEIFFVKFIWIKLFEIWLFLFWTKCWRLKFEDRAVFFYLDFHTPEPNWTVCLDRWTTRPTQKRNYRPRCKHKIRGWDADLPHRSHIATPAPGAKLHLRRLRPSQTNRILNRMNTSKPSSFASPWPCLGCG